MRRLLFVLVPLASLSLLGCQDKAETADLSTQVNAAKQQPGANVPPAAVGKTNAKQAKSGE